MEITVYSITPQGKTLTLLQESGMLQPPTMCVDHNRNCSVSAEFFSFLHNDDKDVASPKCLCLYAISQLTNMQFFSS